jgi:hypothetical protein
MGSLAKNNAIAQFRFKEEWLLRLLETHFFNVCG